MTLTQYYTRRWRRRSTEVKGRRSQALYAVTVLSRSHVARLLGLSLRQVRSAEQSAIAKLRDQISANWREHCA